MCSVVACVIRGKEREGHNHMLNITMRLLYICEVLARLLMPPFSIKDGITVMYVVPT